jgi:hypothetical protein
MNLNDLCLLEWVNALKRWNEDLTGILRLLNFVDMECRNID